MATDTNNQQIQQALSRHPDTVFAGSTFSRPGMMSCNAKSLNA
jgi:hypothetical protein